MATSPNDALARPPLDNPGKQIRLIHLDYEGLASFSDIIRCTLSVHNIEDVEGKYVAVSYCWGSPDLTVPILVDGRPYNVRFNCFYALWQMRLHNTGPLCWIDSICIDQECHGEKEEQVGQMGSIFARAKLVAACLGPPGDDEILFVEQGTRTTHNSDPHHLSSALAYFTRRPYFQRLWIVQECFLARRLEAFCGRHRLTWEALGLRVFHPRNRRDKTAGITYRAPKTLVECAYGAIRESNHKARGRHEREVLSFFQDCDTRIREQAGVQDKRRELWEVVLQYGQRKCYDPRDKVYGLLALAAPSPKRPIDVDYNKPLTRVLIDFVAACDINTAAIAQLKQSIRMLRKEFASPIFDKELQFFCKAQLAAGGTVHRRMSKESCTETVHIKGTQDGKSVQRITWSPAPQEETVDPKLFCDRPLQFDTRPCSLDCKECFGLSVLIRPSKRPAPEQKSCQEDCDANTPRAAKSEDDELQTQFQDFLDLEVLGLTRERLTRLDHQRQGNCEKCVTLSILALFRDRVVSKRPPTAKEPEKNVVIAVPSPDHKRFAIYAVAQKHAHMPLIIRSTQSFDPVQNKIFSLGYVHLEDVSDGDAADRSSALIDRQGKIISIEYLGTVQTLCPNKPPVRVGTVQHLQDITYRIPICPCELVCLSLLEPEESGRSMQHVELQPERVRARLFGEMRDLRSRELKWNVLRWEMLRRSAAHTYWPINDDQDIFSTRGHTAQDAFDAEHMGRVLSAKRQKSMPIDTYKLPDDWPLPPTGDQERGKTGGGIGRRDSF